MGRRSRGPLEVVRGTVLARVGRALGGDE